MPGIWLVSALFFLSGCYWGIATFLGIPFYLIFLTFLIRKKLIPILFLGLFSSCLWAAVGSFVHYNLPKSASEIIPPQTYFVVSGMVKGVDLVDPHRLYLQATTISLAGKKFPFPYLLCVIKKGRRGWDEKLVGSELAIGVYFSGKRFYFIPEDGMNIRPTWLGWVYVLPYYVRKGLYSLMRFLKPEARAVLSASLLGLKDRMYYKIRATFNNIGVGHILAISGLHLMIISTFVFLFLRAINLSYVFSLILIFAFIAGYIMMIPESSSLLRAGIMYELWIISRLLKRNWSIYDLLGFTVMVIFLINPLQIFSLGFQFSFTAVLSILLGFSLLTHHGVIDAWWVGIFASLGLAPIVIRVFGCFPLVSWAITPLFIVCLALLLILGVIYLLSFGFLMGGAINWIVDFMLKVARLVNVNPLPVCLSSLSEGWIYLYYFVLMIAVLIIGLYQIKKDPIREWM